MNATFHNKDGQPWKEGDVYTRRKYAETLEVIQIYEMSDENILTKLWIDEQALAEAGDKGEKNLGFYTGRSNKHHPWGLSSKSIHLSRGRSNITFSS